LKLNSHAMSLPPSFSLSYTHTHTHTHTSHNPTPRRQETGGEGAIQGLSSKDFKEQLGYVGAEEIVHRDNISLLTLRRRSSSYLLPGGASPLQGSSGAPSDTEGVGPSAERPFEFGNPLRRALSAGPDSGSTSRGTSNSPTRLPGMLDACTPVKPGAPGGPGGPPGEAGNRQGEAGPARGSEADRSGAAAAVDPHFSDVGARLSLLKYVSAAVLLVIILAIICCCCE
jgi:hypothetical protein